MFDVNQRVLFGTAGGLLVVATALAGGYYVVSTRSDARAATRAPERKQEAPKAVAKAGAALEALLAKTVDVKTGTGIAKKTWAELGIEIDPGELARSGSVDNDKQLASLGAKGSLPVRVDRDKAVKALLQLKGQYDRGAIDAYLDLEERSIH